MYGTRNILLDITMDIFAMNYSELRKQKHLRLRFITYTERINSSDDPTLKLG